MRARERLWVCLLLVLPSILAPAAHAAASADLAVPEPLVEAVHRALGEWSQFATTGDLALVGYSFMVGGPQWSQFKTEARVGEEPPGAEPLRFEVRRLRLRNLDDATATVWVEVEARREGFVPETFGWDFDLIQEEGRWRVWTVVPSVEPTESAQLPAVDVTTTTSTTTTTLASTEALTGRVGEELAAAAPGPVRGTRIPVLSAWIVVVTVIGVAAAGYMAPRIDRRGEG